MSQEQLQKLQMLDSNLETIRSQKHIVSTQLQDLKAALEELEGASEAYKVVGNVMVLKDKDVLSKETTKNKEFLELKEKTLGDQEKKLLEQIESLRADLLKEMQNAGSDKK